MAVERILLIRHGETEWNVLGRWQGFAPVPLSEKGKAQAQALAEYLRRHYDNTIKTLRSSDLPRAWQTATIIGDALGLTPVADPRWRERNLGVFQGLTREEIAARYPVEVAALAEDSFGYAIPEGESRREVQQRVCSAWEDLVKADGGPVAAVVSHGGALKALLLGLFEDNPDVAQVHLPNTSISVVVRQGDGWHLVELGATPHL